MQDVRQGDTVLVVGVHSNGTATQAAIVTRVWPAQPFGVPAVNVTVLPDEGIPMPRQGVPFYANLDAANQAKARLPFCYPAR